MDSDLKDKVLEQLQALDAGVLSGDTKLEHVKQLAVSLWDQLSEAEIARRWYLRCYESVVVGLNWNRRASERSPGSFAGLKLAISGLAFALVKMDEVSEELRELVSWNEAEAVHNALLEA